MSEKVGLGPWKPRALHRRLNVEAGPFGEFNAGPPPSPNCAALERFMMRVVLGLVWTILVLPGRK